MTPPDATIRIDVNLVQVDAVVTDGRGRRVSDLAASDFEIWQDGKPQRITNFSYLSTKPESTTPSQASVPVKLAKGEIPPPPLPFEPGDVRRALAFVVDDLGLAGENVPSVRTAIKNFVDDQMRPGDLVAIIRTGAGMGALQQFTTDKRLLYAALERIKYGNSRVGVSSFAPLGSTTRGTATLDHFREQTMSVGSLGALRFVVNSMRTFPGRKSVVLFTENIRMMYRGTTDDAVTRAVQQLSDAASRAAVVIHAIDPRGMPNVELTAADNTRNVRGRRLSRVPAQREQEVIDTEQGMFQLSEDTGGLFLHDTNDLAGALRKAAEDSDGYYLLGYRPDASTFDSNGRPKFHRIEVKVRKAALHVRSRDGFFGEPGGNQGVEHTREAEIVQALQSPFAAGALQPRITAVFSHQPKAGSFIDALLYFDAGALKWSTAPDGNRSAAVDLAAAAFDENGLALAPIDTTYNLRLKAQEFDAAMRRGLVYGIRVPISRPGAYVVRAAVRDAATGASAAAQEFVEVPDLAAGHLALSGITLQETVAQPASGATVVPNSSGPAPGEDVSSGAARRSFRRGARLLYSYQIFNAVHPQLESQVRLFHDGRQILDTKSPLNTSTNRDDVIAQGHISLGSQMAPGEYVMQIIVTDTLDKTKFHTVTQSMNFEVQR